LKRKHHFDCAPAFRENSSALAAGVEEQIGCTLAEGWVWSCLVFSFDVGDG